MWNNQSYLEKSPKIGCFMPLLPQLHCVSKNVPPLVCCNFDAREPILIFFGRNVTDKIIKRRFTMPPQVTCASVLPGKTGNTKIAVFTHCISALPEFNQSLLDFFNLFESRLILSLLYDSVNLVINAFSLGLLGGRALEKGSREHCSSWTVASTKHQCAVFWVSSFAR